MHVILRRPLATILIAATSLVAVACTEGDGGADCEAPQHDAGLPTDASEVDADLDSGGDRDAGDGDAGTAKAQITYVASLGGAIDGDATQLGEVGANATTVTARAGAGYRFTGWRDGAASADRTDVFSSAPQVFVADFAPFRASGLTVEDVRVTGITLSWPSVTGATSYTLYVAREPITDVAQIGTLDGGQAVADATSPLDVDGLSVGAAHFVRLVAHADGVPSEASPEVTATPMIAGRYVPETMDGTPDAEGAYIHDVVHDLTWHRCLVGETFTPASMTCTGDATVYDFFASPPYVLPPAIALHTLYYCADTGAFGDPLRTPTPCPSAAPGDLALVQEAFPSTQGSIADNRSFQDLMGTVLTTSVLFNNSSRVRGSSGDGPMYVRLLK